jgi:adenylate kinase
MNTHRKLIVFVGPPGAGKGTLSQFFVERLNCNQLSTGNLLRRHIQEGTDLGKSIDLVLKSGKLISDDHVIAMVVDWLDNHTRDGRPVILDGFPRTKPQAKALDEALQELTAALFEVTVVLMELSDEEAARRILTRLVCSQSVCQAVYSMADFKESSQGMPLCLKCGELLVRRADDVPEALVSRFSIYRQHEKEIMEYYRSSQAPIVTITMEKDPETLFFEVQKRLALV